MMPSNMPFQRHAQLKHCLFRVLNHRDHRIVQCVCQVCGQEYEYPCYGDDNRLKMRIVNFCVQHAHR